MLASNGLAELADLDVLARFARLTQLVLMDNPVTKKEVRLAGFLSVPWSAPCLVAMFMVVVVVVVIMCCGLRGREEVPRRVDFADMCARVCLYSTTDIGSSGGVPPCGSSTTRKSSRRSARRPRSCLARPTSRRSSPRTYVLSTPYLLIPGGGAWLLPGGVHGSGLLADRLTDGNVTQIMGIKSSTFNIPTSNGAATSGSKMKRLKLTDKEKQRLQERIRKATSLEEIIALEKALEEGRLPPGILGDDAMEE